MNYFKLRLFLYLLVSWYLLGILTSGEGDSLGVIGITWGILVVIVGVFFAIDALKTKRARTIYVVCCVMLFSTIGLLAVLTILQAGL